MPNFFFVKSILNDSTKHDTAVIIVFFAELFELAIGVHGIKLLRVLGENSLYRPAFLKKKLHSIVSYQILYPSTLHRTTNFSVQLERKINGYNIWYEIILCNLFFKNAG